MCEVGGGRVVGPRLDEYPAPIQHPRLSLRVSRTNQVLGTDFSTETIGGLLKRLHLPALSLDRENLVVQVPSVPERFDPGNRPHRGGRPAGGL